MPGYAEKKRGFTLVEMMIAMSIFVAFTGILIGSYTSIIKAQREANDYRVMYVEARRVFEVLTQELREGMVDYGNDEYRVRVPGSGSEIYLVSKDDTVKTHIRYASDVVQMSKQRKDHLTGTYGSFGGFVNLNAEGVKVIDFRIRVSPAIDPYDVKYVDYDVNQFHPKVTVYAEFERELSTGKSYTMDLQTTISSRIYNQVYSTP